MEHDFIDRVCPGYFEALPEHYQSTQRATDLAESENLQYRLYQYLGERVGTTSMDRSSGYYHPSEIASMTYCPFSCVQSRLKRPATYRKKPETSLILEIGHSLHAMIERYLSKVYGDNCQTEVVSTFEPLHLSGRCDALITLESGAKQVLEFKTKKSVAGMTSAKPEHVMQATCYEFIHGASFGSVVYLDKTFNKLVEFRHVFDFHIWEEVVNRVVTMEATLLNNQLPTPVPHRFCSECDYTEICPTYKERAGRYARE
jgi:CRISPR/Cas system-associated exonuclease Cas4 (RecB family)